MKRAAVRCRHDRSLKWSFCRIGRAHRGLRGDHSTAGGTGQHPEQRGGPQRQRRMAVGRLFCFAMQRPAGPAENGRNSAIAGPSRLPSDRPLEGRGRAFPALGRRDRAVDAYPRRWRLCVDSGRRQQEAVDILWYELNPHCCQEGIAAEDVQIFVEVAQPRRQRDRFNASNFRALRQNCLHRISGGIAVASDVEPTHPTGATWPRGGWPKVPRPSAGSAERSAERACSPSPPPQQARHARHQTALRCQAENPSRDAACRSPPCRNRKDQARCGGRL